MPCTGQQSVRKSYAKFIIAKASKGSVVQTAHTNVYQPETTCVQCVHISNNALKHFFHENYVLNSLTEHAMGFQIARCLGSLKELSKC